MQTPDKSYPTGKAKDKPDSAQMRKVASMYYIDGKNRQAISKELGIDPRKTAWLLEMSRKLGIVRVDIREPENEQLAGRLERLFPHLEKVMIAPGPKIETPEQHDDLFKRFGLIAADYFEELVGDRPRGKAKPIRVGVTGSQHALAFANAVPQRVRENVYVHVTALIGRGKLDETALYVEPGVVASILWTHCGTLNGHCEYATVSPYDSHPVKAKKKTGLQVIADELERLKENENLAEVVKAMDNLDVVVGGIGIGNPGKVDKHLRDRVTMTTLLKGIITPKDLSDAIGDFAYCPYTAAGKPSRNARLFVTAGHYDKQYWGVEFYKKMVQDGKIVVAFSGGSLLVPATKAALKAQIINVLIIDEHSARTIADDPD